MIPELETIADSSIFVDGSGGGSGTVIAHHGNNSYILSCEHVVHNVKKVKITYRLPDYSFMTLNATVERTDVDRDLSLLRTSRRINAPAMDLAADEPELYSRVYGVGAANGIYGIAFEGVLSGIPKLTPQVPPDKYIYTGLAVEGMSGGTLTDVDGEFIGVIMSILRSGENLVWPIGYAVSLPTVKEFLGPISVQKHKKLAKATKRRNKL